ncbi:MAG: HAD family hydrolase [Massilibacteroides sp.]|nr:HAD family hydrolase [Massilibacteroides sp.]MDD3064259.1 HAD family hydrolase [Massilibacteroides sp.]MDD4114975.1 HAD family hydrolase [Massilibacteroides sp.]MDD4659909.1 HAD family hydrolase [Massilibacteroides sp.]
MKDLKQVKGILLDYGGTIDSNGIHWAEIIWSAYEMYMVPISKEVFREAYVYGERTLAKNPFIQPNHTFRDMLRIKTGIQMQWLQDNNKLTENCFSEDTSQAIAEWCYSFAREKTTNARQVIQELAHKYPLVLVSNFYGNIESVLRDFRLDSFFDKIIESAVVGVRKPDPEIFRLGVKQLNMNAENVVVIGDSYDKDIIPATSLGCQTIWLKNIGWEEYKGNEKADVIISDFLELRTYLLS